MEEIVSKNCIKVNFLARVVSKNSNLYKWPKSKEIAEVDLNYVFATAVSRYRRKKFCLDG